MEGNFLIWPQVYLPLLTIQYIANISMKTVRIFYKGDIQEEWAI
jgi:hypothetical protein